MDRVDGVERVTGDECQRGVVRIDDEAAAARIDDVDANYLVEQLLTIDRVDDQQFASRNVLQEAEVRVAVPCDNRVAGLAR